MDEVFDWFWMDGWMRCLIGLDRVLVEGLMDG